MGRPPPLPIHLNNLKLLTFDATGTLLRFTRPPTQVYRDFGAKHGFHVNPQDLSRAFKQQWKSLNQTQPHFGLCWRTWWSEFVVGTFKASIPSTHPANDEKLKSLANDLIDHFRTKECWALKPGAPETLEKLRDFKTRNRGLKLGIISNFDPRLREILDALGVSSSYFDFILLSHELQMSKPSPDIFNYAVNEYCSKEELELPSKPCLHVGDNYELDFVGATLAGWKGALVLPKDERDFKVATAGEEGEIVGSDFQSSNNVVVVYESLSEFNSALVS